MAKADPFERLQTAKRSITPRKLRGEPLKLWNQLIQRIADDEFDGVGYEELHDWCVEFCGINCTVTSTRLHIKKAVAALQKK